jgi:hypothetical protein
VHQPQTLTPRQGDSWATNVKRTTVIQTHACESQPNPCLGLAAVDDMRALLVALLYARQLLLTERDVWRLQ